MNRQALIARLKLWFPFLSRFLQSEQVWIIIAAALVGVGAAYGAILFRAMIMGSGLLFFGDAHGDVTLTAAMPWWRRLLLPALGGLLLAPIVVRWASEAKGSGIPEVIEAVALKGGAVRRRVVGLKALAAAICIGSGGSAGREGPIVHVGAAIGSWIAQTLRLSVKQMRTLVGCGVASGIAATFNTPFAGALFAVEVVLGDFGTAKIGPIVIASVVATVVSRRFTEEFPQLEVPPFAENIDLISVQPYVVVGIGCAVVGALFIKMMGWGWRLGAKWKLSPYLLPAFGGLLVGIIGFFRPEVYGVGYETINAVMNESPTALFLVVLLAAKMIATTATLTSGGSGGIFAPSLFLGAATGSLIGVITETLAPGLIGSPHAYALVGMGAMVAATTRAPISAVLVIFEMTRDYNTIVPLMAACIPSVLLCAALHRDSIYISKLTHRGISLKPKGQVNLLKGLRASDVMQRRVETVSPALPLADLIERFLGTTLPIIWVTDSKGRLLGVIESRDFQVALMERESLLELVLAQDLMKPVEHPVRPGDDLSFIARMLHEVPYEVMPVVDEVTGALLGDLMRSDIIESYNRELEHRDSIETAIDAIHLADRIGTVDIGDGYAIMEYEVPKHVSGQTLAQLNLRKKIDAQVLLVRRGDKRLVPGPETALQTGDTLLLAGEAQRITQRLAKL